MPIRRTATKKATQHVLKNIAYESCVTSWLMDDAWQVFNPMCENGHKTDVLISDGPNFYRIQIKTIAATSGNQRIQNKWKEADLDYVVVFARNSDWGYIMPAFETSSRALDAPGHIRFKHSRKSFLKAFHQV